MAASKPEAASKPLFLRLSVRTRAAVEAFADKHGLTLNEAGARLLERGLSAANASQPYMAGAAAPVRDATFAQHGASLVSGLNIQVGPTPRKGPLLKKAAK